jgi:lysozyme family protein
MNAQLESYKAHLIVSQKNSEIAGTPLKLKEQESEQIQMSIDYKALFNSMKITPEKIPDVLDRAYYIKLNKSDYVVVESATQIPWYIVGIIHSMECDLNFEENLLNGDPLTARTVNVPKGRPFSGTPPFSWTDAAIDALSKSALWVPTRGTNWTTLEALEFMERYNGLGYAQRGINSPYLWSFTNLYTKGLFVSDNKFDPDAVSNQVGAAALLRVMSIKGYITLEGLR